MAAIGWPSISGQRKTYLRRFHLGYATEQPSRGGPSIHRSFVILDRSRGARKKPLAGWTPHVILVLPATVRAGRRCVERLSRLENSRENPKALSSGLHLPLLPPSLLFPSPEEIFWLIQNTHPTISLPLPVARAGINNAKEPSPLVPSINPRFVGPPHPWLRRRRAAAAGRARGTAGTYA
jgi:hypothetical protein